MPTPAFHAHAQFCLRPEPLDALLPRVEPDMRPLVAAALASLGGRVSDDADYDECLRAAAITHGMLQRVPSQTGAELVMRQVRDLLAELDAWHAELERAAA